MTKPTRYDLVEPLHPDSPIMEPSKKGKYVLASDYDALTALLAKYRRDAERLRKFVAQDRITMPLIVPWDCRDVLVSYNSPEAIINAIRRRHKGVQKMSIIRCDKHGQWDSDQVEQCPRCADPVAMTEMWLAAHGLEGFKLYPQETIDTLRSQLQVAQQERDCWKTLSPCELMAGNAALMEYGKHWEGRAEQAESRNKRIVELLKEPNANFSDWLESQMPPGTVISNAKWWAPNIQRAMSAELLREVDK